MIEHAMIFAAGRGERMRPLTDDTPKPLLFVRGKPLIVWHLENLAAAGVREVAINTSHLAEQFPAQLGDGERWGLQIHYSYEGPRPLDTGGGMREALSLLGSTPFIAVNADIWTDFDFSKLPENPPGLAHLVMVRNPPHHPEGDFTLRDGVLHDAPDQRLTFAGIGVYKHALLKGQVRGTYGLAPILRDAMRAGKITGELYRGVWKDIGTPQRMEELNRSRND